MIKFFKNMIVSLIPFIIGICNGFPIFKPTFKLKILILSYFINGYEEDSI
jgi:hypothetical protein